MPVTNEASGIKAGTVAYFAANTVPPGWLKANGAAVSRTTYAALFLAIGTTYGAGDGSTTFQLPDLRGEFLRGFDDGRGVDSGRGIGTAQAHQNASHQHTGNTAGAGDHSHSGGEFTGQNLIGGSSGAFVRLNTNAANNTGVAGNHGHAFTTDASGGGEARPRNVAMLACIKF